MGACHENMGWKIVTATLWFICQVDSTIDWKENQLTKRVKSQSELTELKARDTSCPRGKKVELKIIRTIGIYWRSYRSIWCKTMTICSCYRGLRNCIPRCIVFYRLMGYALGERRRTWHFQKTIRTPKEKSSFTGAACRAIRRVQTSYIKVGVWSFP